MDYRTADGARINTILGKKVFRNHLIATEEVKAKTGLSIRELILCWIFDPRNDFQKALNDWRETGEPMDFETVQGY